MLRVLTIAAGVLVVLLGLAIAVGTSFGPLSVIVLAIGAGLLYWAYRQRKRCPECAEGVRPKAQVCRHCGHRFTSPA